MFLRVRKKIKVIPAMTKDAYTRINKTDSEIVLVAGDKDYMPVIEDLKNEGFRVVVVFWDHAAQEVKQAASKFISLNQWLSHLQK